MEVTIRESSLKMKSLVMESITGKMENLIKDSGTIAKWMEKVSLSGQMVKSMKENTKMIKSMVMEFFNGKMGGDMKDNGLMENNME